MEEKDLFYCIKLINDNGTRGWLFDSPDGIKIITGGLHANITQFKTEKEAADFIRSKKLERRGTKAYIRTNQDIIDEVQKVENKGVFTTEKPFYYLENQIAAKCFYDSKREAYYFTLVEFGFPVWPDESSITEFVRAAQFEEGMIFLVKSEKGKKQKKLIQVYGKKEGEDEPKHIPIEGNEWTDYR